MRLVYASMIAALFVMSSCGTSSAPSNASATAAPVPASGTPPSVVPESKLNAAGTQLLMGVVGKYYSLKNALVATRGAEADSAASQLAVAADGFSAFIQKDSANSKVLKPYMDSIAGESRLASVVNDASCERQRLLFGSISSAMFGILQNVELKHSGVYREYCPMAFNEKGAYWLSAETEIKNPYFGKKMIECGEVTDTL